MATNNIESFNPVRHLFITGRSSQHNSKFNVTITECNVQFRNLERICLFTFVDEALAGALQVLLEGVQDNSKVGIKIDHPDVPFPIETYILPKQQINAQLLVDKFEEADSFGGPGADIMKKMKWTVTVCGMPA